MRGPKKWWGELFTEKIECQPPLWTVLDLYGHPSTNSIETYSIGRTEEHNSAGLDPTGLHYPGAWRVFGEGGGAGGVNHQPKKGEGGEARLGGGGGRGVKPYFGELAKRKCRWNLW